jgi:hypothetical protein
LEGGFWSDINVGPSVVVLAPSEMVLIGAGYFLCQGRLIVKGLVENICELV